METVKTIQYHRNPTPFEVKKGYGATHYRDVELSECINPKTGQPKKWFKSKYDGLRYYKS